MLDSKVTAEEAQLQPTEWVTGSEVQVVWGAEVTTARVLAATPQMLLLEGARPGRRALGYPVRIRALGGRRGIEARLAAVGQAERYLLSLGSRAVRWAARQRVDLRGIVRAPRLQAPAPVRIVDLSSSGAALRGQALQVGTECDLTFVPPAQAAAITVRCFVVRAQRAGAFSNMGVAFCGTALSLGGDG